MNPKPPLLRGTICPSLRTTMSLSASNSGPSNPVTFPRLSSANLPQSPLDASSRPRLRVSCSSWTSALRCSRWIWKAALTLCRRARRNHLPHVDWRITRMLSCTASLTYTSFLKPAHKHSRNFLLIHQPHLAISPEKTGPECLL